MISGQPGLLLEPSSRRRRCGLLATATGLAVAVAGRAVPGHRSPTGDKPREILPAGFIAAIAVPLLLGLWTTKLPLASAVSLAFAVAATTFAPYWSLESGGDGSPMSARSQP